MAQKELVYLMVGTNISDVTQNIKGICDMQQQQHGK